MAQQKLSMPTWSSRTVFLLAAIGSAVGLGNLWKFPYVAGENGGGAFVLVYLACILLIGVPVLIAELTLGRSARANPIQAMHQHTQQDRANKLWVGLGVNGMLAGILILSFYSVITGWSLAYFFDSLQGDFLQIPPAQAEQHFAALLASPWQLLFWHTLVMIITTSIVARGLRSGIEKAINIMLPGLLLILMVLLIYAVGTGAFAESFAFLFTPDFSKLSWQGVLVAMGHAFFTLSIGMAAMMVYGAYLDQRTSIVKASLVIAVADTLIALLAGLVIFSIVFANQLPPSSGPGLLFQTLPMAFGQMWGGWFFGTLFFALVFFAALSSAISLLEPTLSWLEHNRGIGRMKGALGLGGLVWLIGIGTVLSFNQWSELTLIGDKTVFALLDFLTANILLPAGGLLICLYLAWVMARPRRQAELRLEGIWQTLLLWDLRWVAPLAILWVFVSNLFSASSTALWAFLSVLVLYGFFVAYQTRSREEA